MNYRNQEIIDYVDKVEEEIKSGSHHNCYRDHFFPQLIEKLELKTGVEIGVDKGGFTKHLLSKTTLDMLYAIDPWPDNFGSDYKPGYFDKNGNNRMQECYENIKDYVDAGRAKIIRATSVDAASKVDNDLDFVYIDGDHSLEGIFYDIYTWVPKLKVGGICAGHDWKLKENMPNSGINDYWGKQLPYAVTEVVTYYARRYGYKVKVVGGRILNWYFVKV